MVAQVILMTDIGMQKLADAAVSGITVKFRYFAVGDANGTQYVPTGAETQLVNERWRGDLGVVRVSPGTAIVEMNPLIPEYTGGYTICEFGVYDEVGDLVAIGVCVPINKPDPAIAPVSLYLEILFKPDNASAVSFKLNMDGYATYDYLLNSYLIQSKNIVDKSVTKDKLADNVLEDYAPINNPALTGDATLNGYPIATVKAAGQKWIQSNLNDDKIFKIEYNLDIYVAAGAAGIYTSSDGITWAKVFNAEFIMADIAHANGMWVVSSTSNNSSYTGIHYSSNATQWTKVISPETVYCIAHGGDSFIAGSVSGIHRSLDGIVWNKVKAACAKYAQFSNGTWVAGTNKGLLTSIDGVNWLDSNVTDSGMEQCTYGNGIWLASNFQGKLYKSTDNGKNWSIISNIFGEPNYVNGFFFTSKGYYSSDGDNWLRSDNRNSILISYLNGVWISVGYKRNTYGIKYSFNLYNWYNSDCGSNLFNCVKSYTDSDLFLVGGNDGSGIKYSKTIIGQLLNSVFEDILSISNFVRRLSAEQLDNVTAYHAKCKQIMLSECNDVEYDNVPLQIRDVITCFGKFTYLTNTIEQSIKLESGIYQRQFNDEQHQEFIIWQDALASELNNVTATTVLPITPQFIESLL